MNTINKGFVQKYIQKTWDMDDLVTKVRDGLIRFRNTFENEKLVRTAKQQSKKLFQLSNELNEKVANNRKNVLKRDEKIAQIKTEVEKAKNGQNTDSPISMEGFEKLFEQHDILESDKLKLF